MSIIRSYQTLKEYRSDPLGFIKKAYQENHHFTHLNIFGRELFIVSHPDEILHVLKNNHQSYSKGRTTKALSKFLGSGLITNDGATWRKQHRLIRPIMNLKSVFSLASKIDETCEEFMPELMKGEKVNSFREVNRLTWRIILRTLFSQEVTQEMDDWLDDILELMQIVTHKTRSTLPLPYWVPTKRHRRLKSIIDQFDAHVYSLIQDRRKGESKEDFLQLLIDAQEEGESRMTDLEIRDEVMTFMMAGHETITNSMSWTLIELAKHPEIFPKLREEADAFKETKNFEVLNAAPWLGAVIDEVMRMWPPVWVFMRQADKEDTLRGQKVPVGANVVLATYLSHHSPDFWEAPEEFRPERFLPEHKKKIPTGAYYPFGLGPRACIGAYFAGMEARIILATLIHHFDWSLAQALEPQTSAAEITLRPTSNLTMRFRRRRV
jgi:cytochrome P450